MGQIDGYKLVIYSNELLCNSGCAFRQTPTEAKEDLEN
jgi:hypothetical protein